MLRGGGGAAPPPTGPGAREPGAGAGSIGTEVNSTPPLGVLVILIWWPGAGRVNIVILVPLLFLVLLLQKQVEKKRPSSKGLF